MNASLTTSSVVARASTCCRYRHYADLAIQSKPQLALHTAARLAPAKNFARRHLASSSSRLTATASATAAVNPQEQAKVNPLLHPVTAWQQWWYIGATPKADLPQSQKFSRILARLWGCVKHSKRTLTFAVLFMVRVTLCIKVWGMPSIMMIGM